MRGERGEREHMRGERERLREREELGKCKTKR